MNQYTLAAIQSALVLKMQDSVKPLSGYDLTKILNKAGYMWSHQQVYRYLAKMPLQNVLVPQNGKPDKRLYSLDGNVEYIHQAGILPIPLIEEYKMLDHAIERVEIINNKTEDVTRRLRAFDKAQLQFEANYLNTLIATWRK